MIEMLCLPQERGTGLSFLVGGAVRQDPTTNQPIWQRRCESGACVEIALQGEVVMIRSSTTPEVTVTLTRVEWQEFLVGAKQGLFDQL